MTMAASFVGELEHETKVTRTALERVPEDRFTWKPHEKSMSMIELASHLAEMFSWTPAMTGQDRFDMDPSAYTPWVAESKQQLLDTFDQNVDDALRAIREVSDEAMGETWTMAVSGRTVMQMPRGAVIRNILINHMIHHRAQLGIYLRLNEVAVPRAYGPSADEASFA